MNTTNTTGAMCRRTCGNPTTLIGYGTCSREIGMKRILFLEISSHLQIVCNTLFGLGKLEITDQNSDVSIYGFMASPSCGILL